MRAVFLLLGALLLGAVVALAQADGSTSRSRAESRFDYEELAKAPDKARAKHNPLAGDESAVAGGKKLFEQHCAECHGAMGEGGKKAPSLGVDERRGAAGDAGVVETAGGAALAVGELRADFENGCAACGSKIKRHPGLPGGVVFYRLGLFR
jgi:cytochrome c5